MKRPLANKILYRILAGLSRKILQKYQPMIIGVTGSVGKSSTKEAVYAVFAEAYGAKAVRRNIKNFNNEIGMPVTIIGSGTPGRNPFKWVALIFKAWAMTQAWDENYPKILILEMGVDRPGDMDHLISIATPHIAILTTVGLSHLEYFSTPDGILREKSQIFKELGKHDFAILNHDDQKVISLLEDLHVQTQTVTFGLSSGSKIQVESYAVSGRELEMQIGYKGEAYQVRLQDTLGLPHVMACAAGFAAGVAAGIDPKKIAVGLQNYKSELGRLRVVPAICKSVIIDDSYNAAPASMHAALTEFFAYPAEQRIAALGDMLELGDLSEASHRAVGDVLAEMIEKKKLQYAI